MKSRWFRLKFEKLNPQLKGIVLERADSNCLKKPTPRIFSLVHKGPKEMKEAHRSVWVVTSHIHNAIKERHNEQFYQDLVEEVENVSEDLGVDIQAQRMYTLMLFCAKKVIKN